MEPRLYSVKRVAVLLDVSPRHVWRLVTEGKLAAPHKMGPKCSRWFAEDVQEYLTRLHRGDFREPAKKGQ